MRTISMLPCKGLFETAWRMCELARELQCFVEVKLPDGELWTHPNGDPEGVLDLYHLMKRHG